MDTETAAKKRNGGFLSNYVHKNQNRDKSGRNETKLTSNPTNKYLTEQTNQYQYINVKKMSIKSTLVAVRKKFTSRISKTLRWVMILILPLLPIFSLIELLVIQKA